MANVSTILDRWLHRDPASRRNRRTSVTALDVEDGWLHVVQASLRGAEPRITRHLAVPLALPPDAPAEAPETLGPAIANALRDLRLDTNQVVMGIPRAQAILRVLQLPPARGTAEVASMVHFQISRDLPFRLDETVIDFEILPEVTRPPPAEGTLPTPGATSVLTAVIRREKVAFFPVLARAAGLKLQGLGLRPLAAGAAAGWCVPEARHGCVALVSIQASEITFDVLLDGQLVFSRVAALPATGAAPATADPEPAVLEIVRSLHNYEGLPGHGRLTTFYLAGTHGTDPAIAQTLEKRSGIPTRALDPATRLAGIEGNQAHAGGSLPALGLALLALEPAGAPIDFLAPKNPPAPVDNRRLRRLAAVAGIVALLLSIAGLRSRLIRQREAVRNELQQQLTLASKNLPGYRTARAQAKSVTDWSAGNRNWLDHLTLLSTLLPPSLDLHVTSLATTPRNSLSLSVRVRSGEIIDRLSTDLRQAGFLVKPPGISPVNDRAGYRFQASLEIDAPAAITNRLDDLTTESRPAPRPPPVAAVPAPVSSPARSLGTAAPPASRPARPIRRRPEGGLRE